MSAADDTAPEAHIHPLPEHHVEKAIRLSMAQAMIGAIYAASTGGMFLIGYALKLGANNVQIGLMSTIPMMCVVVQLISSLLVEKGVSRRSMTICGAFLNVSCWMLIIALPYVAAKASANVRIGALIAVISLVTVFANISGNARTSWVGDLIPAKRRGSFFGRIIMFSGLIASIFALIEGRFLDIVKSGGISAFSWLFLFGMLFGLLNASFFVPQPDVPITKHGPKFNPLALFKQFFTNKPLLTLMAFATIWSMQTIASPFYATYLLRDLKMPFLGVGILNTMVTITMLAFSPFWGHIVDKYGCRPVLVACGAAIAPFPLLWIWMTNAHLVYRVIIPMNFLQGFPVAGISVALSTMIYKVTDGSARTMQLAMYSILVTLIAAPFPTIGGHLPTWLHSIGIHSDLRCTFYAVVPMYFIASIIARYIDEPDARRARDLVRNLPNHLLQRKDSTLV